MTSKPRIVISGSGSAIAQALITQLLEGGGFDIHGISRTAAPIEVSSEVDWHVSDYSDGSLREIADTLAATGPSIDYLIVANGLLHGGDLQPERALRNVDQASMASVFDVNAILPIRVLAAMTPLLRRADGPRIVVFSARVGSIADNRLGGWYSYRGSKAALNMMMKCAAIEFRRLNKNAKLIAFHPGTTDTPLSEPFQARVSPDKLFSPRFVAERLWHVIEHSVGDGELSYLDWAGEPIPW